MRPQRGHVPPFLLAGATLWALAIPSAHSAEVSEVAAVDGANLQRPSWSPDGARLSYEANHHARRTIELYIGVPESRTFRRLKGARRSTNAITAGFVSASPATQVVQELSWGPGQGDGYVFSASPDAKDFDLYLDGGGAIAPFPGADGGPRWSPDGSKLVFTSARTGGGDLYLLEADAMEADPRRLTTTVGSSELFPDWSSDGTRLVYVAHSDTGDHVWLLDDLNAPPRQLTSEPGSQVRPRFSPDGSQVAYYATAPTDAEPTEPDEVSERWSLMVRSLDSDTPTRLLEDVKPDLAGPAWAPTGNHLLAVRRAPEALDPISWIPVTPEPDPEPVDLDLGTVNHGDLAVVPSGDRLRLAFVSQGRTSDAIRAFKRLFIADIPVAPTPE